MSGWEGNNLQRLIELVGGDENESFDHLQQRSIEAYKYRFAEFLNENDTVLDFGSGLGFGADAFATSVKKYVCADVSRSMLSHVSDKVERIHIHRNDLSKLYKYKFSKIIVHAVFVHLEVPEIVYYLKNFRPLLEDNGEVLFTYKNLDLLDTSDNLFVDHTEQLMSNREFQARSISYASPSVIRRLAEQLGYKYVEVNDYVFDLTARLINERLDI